MKTAPYFIRTPAKEIDVVEPGVRARKGCIAFELGRDVSFSTTAFESFAFKRWEALTYDAIIVAAAVEYADKIIKRPPHAWARHLELCIPVHEPCRWRMPDVADALHDALRFLTGDIWKICFVKRVEAEPVLSLGMLPLRVPTESILAFSDGMDSCAVAGIVGAELGDGLVRVRISGKASNRSRANGKHEPFIAVPYKVLSNMSNRETSARSRGFKFAIISGIAAYLTNAASIIIPESGQGIIGPALIPVGHAYPDFRSHPLFMRRMERFLSALFDKEFSFVFPRIWNTKSETLQEYLKIKGIDAWQGTKSCWRSSQWSSVNGKRKQCGVCAACMLRRLSVHAAGLTEASDAYICEDLTASTLEAAVNPNFKGMNQAFKEYALAGVLHMDHLADMARANSSSEVKRHAARLEIALRFSRKELIERLTYLMSKHAKEWAAFVNSLGAHSFIRQWVRVER